MKQTLKTAIIEIVSVIFAVLFALGVNSMYDDYQRQKLADEALQKITQEIEINRKLFVEQTQVLDTLIQNLESYIAFLETKKGDNRYNINYEMPTFNTTAWETAKLTDIIQDIDYTSIEKLTQTYELIEFYESLVTELISRFMAPEFHDNSKSIFLFKSMRMISKNLHSISQAGLASFDEVISHLEQP